MAVAAATVITGAVATTVYLVDREHMKERDEEIAAERRRTRAEESKLLFRQPNKEPFQHISHNHPLFEVYVSPNVYRCCGVCNQQVAAATLAYHCSHCNYYLHQVCAKSLVSLSSCAYSRAKEIRGPADVSTISTFAHPEHNMMEVYSNEKYKCRHCFTQGLGNRFSCHCCKVHLHPVCAKNPTEISSFMHPQHQLELKTRPHFTDCAICDHKIGSSIRMYRCKPCKFYVHPTCSQLPQHLMHELHPPHPLQLRPAFVSRNCNANCRSKCEEDKWCYECKTCNISIHISCVLKHSAQNKSKDINETIQVLNLVVKVANIASNLDA